MIKNYLTYLFWAVRLLTTGVLVRAVRDIQRPQFIKFDIIITMTVLVAVLSVGTVSNAATITNQPPITPNNQQKVATQYQAGAQDIRCPEFRVTRYAFGPEVADLPSAVRADGGPNARPAEWSEIKACFANFGLGYFHRLGIGKGYRNNAVLVLVNGSRYFQARSRAYFAEFLEGTLPPDWLVHDQVGGNQISLGSWSSRMPALYVVGSSNEPSDPSVAAASSPLDQWDTRSDSAAPSAREPRPLNPEDVQLIRGSCGDKSHIAEGIVTDDLTKHQRPVFCDFVVIFNIGGDDHHKMVQFGQSGAQNIIAFAGYLQGDGVMMSLSRVYFIAGQATPVNEGFCKFFFANQKMTSIVCGANIVNGIHKVVPVISFGVAAR